MDDDGAVCDSIRALLEVHGAYVHTYEGGVAFLRASPKVDCLILDYDMPGLSGPEVEALYARGSAWLSGYDAG